MFIGNTLFDRGAQFPHFEAMLQKGHTDLGLVIRTLAWAGDEVDLMPRPENFGTLNQHITAQKADVIFAAFGFNESFGGVEAHDVGVGTGERGTRHGPYAFMPVLHERQVKNDERSRFSGTVRGQDKGKD